MNPLNSSTRLFVALTLLSAVLLVGGQVVPYALARIPLAGESRGNLAAGGAGRAHLHHHPEGKHPPGPEE